MTFYADKRWGHGRLRQLRTRLACGIFGHDFEEPAVESVQRCRNGCGGMRRV